MANRYEVKCISKDDRLNPYESITAIGGFAGGENWKISQKAAIDGIESGKWEFFVKQGGKCADVVVAKSRWGTKYIKTTADGSTPDNLLSLYECQ